MLICHVCGANNEDTAELCVECGAQLSKEAENVQETESETVILNPTLAVSVNDPVTAEIFGDVLKDNGIPFSNGSMSGAAMHLGFGGGFFAVDFYVDESNLERANELYGEIDLPQEI